MPVSPARRSLRQEYHEFEDSLECIVRKKSVGGPRKKSKLQL
jgi:hypothetical protein